MRLLLEELEIKGSFSYNLQEELSNYYSIIRLNGACINAPPNLFYTKNYSDNFNAIPRFCANCPVHMECLFFALGNSEFGIWGGTPERVRELICIKARKENPKALKDVWSESLWNLVKKIAIEEAYAPERDEHRTGHPAKAGRILPNPMHKLKPGLD